MLGLFGFALTAAYYPFIAGAATTPRWAVAALAPLALLFIKPGRITWAHIVGLAFVGYAVLSLTWSPTLDTHDWLLKLFILTGIFILGSSIEDTRPLWTGAAFGLLISAGMIVIEAGGLVDGLGIPRTDGLFHNHEFPAGLFGNGIFYAEAAAIVAVAPALHRQWVLAACLIAPLFMLNAVPRGPLIALAVAGFAWLVWGRGWKPGLLGCGGILAAALTGATFLNPHTASLRVAMWCDVLLAFKPFGYGYGAYHATIPFHTVYYDASQWVEVAPHNEAMGILYELGAPGLILAGLFVLLALYGGTMQSRLILIVFLTEAVFGFGLHLPVTACLFVLMAGHASRGLPVWYEQAGRWRAFVFGRGGDNLGTGKRHRAYQRRYGLSV